MQIAQDQEKTDSILILARTNNSLKKFKEKYSSIFSMFPNIETSTIHSSKGKEADIVILIDTHHRLYGLPTSFSSHILKKALIFTNDTRLEDRRLFYVALTRAKKSLYIPTTTIHISSFVEEIIKMGKDKISVEDLSDTLHHQAKNKIKPYAPCPLCKKGKVVKKSNSYTQKKFLGCSNWKISKCKWTQEIVEDEAA